MADSNLACPPADLQRAIEAFQRYAFAALLAGGTPPIAEVVELASRDANGIAQAIAWLDRHGALERDGGRLIGSHGLTHRPTAHTLIISGRALHTWCAYDAVAIPVALATSAHAETTCPTCGRDLVVTINDGDLADQSEAVLWMPTSPCQHTMDDFCAHANLFCNRGHLDTWRRQAGDPPGEALDLSGVPARACSTWPDVAVPR